MNLTTLTTDDLLHDLGYETHPGAHTASLAGCGHWSRRYACANCIDAELLRRGIDATADGRYERKHGRIMRKGAAC